MYPPDPQLAPLNLFSIVVPAHNESDCITDTLNKLYDTLTRHDISHEIVVVDDNSRDNTWSVLEELQKVIPTLVPVRQQGPNGYGRAVITGLNHIKGDAAAIMMADESDDAEDAVLYWRKLNEGYDCVFGSRFVKGGKTIDYPRFKYVINRMANTGLRLLFRIPLNDTTNAFKAYRKSVLDGCRPFLSPHFNLTIEIPLKAIVRGYSWTVVPISWRNRTTGKSKLKLKEMGSRYFFICMYVWLEKYFSRGDYHRRNHTPENAG